MLAGFTDEVDRADALRTRLLRRVVFMARPILVGYDPAAGDRAPVEFGIAAAEFTGAPLIVGAVHASAAALGPGGAGAVEEQLADGPGESLEHLGTELRRQGVGVECRP